MKTIIEHINHLQKKPHHVRKRVAFGVATLGSTVVALVWLIGSFATGAFSIHGSDFAMSTGQTASLATTSASSNSGIAGTAAALQDTQGPARIEIVDTQASAPTVKQTDKTILPF